MNSHSQTTVNQLTGVNAGAGPVVVGPTSSATGQRLRDNGWQFGGLAGLNIQHGPLVWGVEGDFDQMWAKRSETSVYTLPGTGLTTDSTVVARRSFNPNWMATVRGRLGFAMNRVLLYGTGGVAFADMTTRTNFDYAPNVTPAVVTANPGTSFGPYFNGGGSSSVHTGWTAGGGVEFLASNNVTLGAEYRHTDIGGFSYLHGSSGANSVQERGRANFTDDAVLGRVTLKFAGLTHF